MGNLAKGDDDLRNPLRQTLAGAKIKGRAGPAPIAISTLSATKVSVLRVLVADLFA